YSLGCTLYHLLAGKPPFAGGPYITLVSKMLAHLDVPPQPITQLCPEAPAGLADVLNRMLAKDPADRFATPAEGAEALEPYTAGADLCRLIDAEIAKHPLMESRTPHAVAPANAAWDEELTENPKPPGRLTRRRLLVMSLAGICLALTATAFFWLYDRSPLGRSGKRLAITEMHVTHYSDEGKMLVGDLQMSSTPVRVNDNVRIAAKLTEPAYYYLIAFNPKGSEAGMEQLCHPEGENGKGAETAPPDRDASVEYPRG